MCVCLLSLNSLLGSSGARRKSKPLFPESSGVLLLVMFVGISLLFDQKKFPCVRFSHLEAQWSTEITQILILSIKESGFHMKGFHKSSAFN